MCEHKNTCENHSFTSLKCETWDIMLLITEIHKTWQQEGRMHVFPGMSFRLKETQNVGDFTICIRDPLNDSKQHIALLYTGLQEHFLVLMHVRVLGSWKSPLSESYSKNSTVNGYCTDVTWCFQHYMGRNSYRLQDESIKIRSSMSLTTCMLHIFSYHVAVKTNPQRLSIFLCK